MKVWEKLLALENIGYNFQMVIEICRLETCCPAKLESKYHFIGDKRFEKFCGLGCSVGCISEYLDLKITS